MSVRRDQGSVRTRRGVGLYWVLLSAQLVGVAILLANMIPLYRLMVLDFSNYRPDLTPSWAIAGMLMILGDMDYPPLRALGVLMIFFSLFCATLELERLARALQESCHEGGAARPD